MDPNATTLRQTVIIDDAEAIGLAMQMQCKQKKKPKEHKIAATQNGAKSKPKCDLNTTYITQARRATQLKHTKQAKDSTHILHVVQFKHTKEADGATQTAPIRQAKLTFQVQEVVQLEPAKQMRRTTQVDRITQTEQDPQDSALCIAQPARNKEPPFLKVGRHGRNGDFVGDPDLDTGRGHQVNPVDEALYYDYLGFYREFTQMYPKFPKLESGEQVSEGIRTLRLEAESWYRNFRETYWGWGTGHLWPCGCEVPRNGDESEEE